jgi:acyl-coenzyme A synthetase/AMP-(fatty) acid ligase
VRAFVRSRLSGHKTPHEVEVVTQLPRTASGKIDRRALRNASAVAVGIAER